MGFRSGAPEGYLRRAGSRCGKWKARPLWAGCAVPRATSRQLQTRVQCDLRRTRDRGGSEIAVSSREAGTQAYDEALLPVQKRRPAATTRILCEPHRRTIAPRVTPLRDPQEQ